MCLDFPKAARKTFTKSGSISFSGSHLTSFSARFKLKWILIAFLTHLEHLVDVFQNCVKWSLPGTWLVFFFRNCVEITWLRALCWHFRRTNLPASVIVCFLKLRRLREASKHMLRTRHFGCMNNRDTWWFIYDRKCWKENMLLERCTQLDL